MTTRYKGLTVLLTQDTRDDDAESIINAILMVKGVANVQPIETTFDDWLNRERIKSELSRKLYAVLSEKTTE